MIGFLTRDFNGKFPDITPAGCCYYRCYLPMALFGKNALLGMPAWDPNRGFGIRDTKETGIFGFSIIVLKLIMDSWTPRQIEIAQSLGQTIIVDIDDFHEGLTPANRAYEITHPELNKKSNREYYRQVIAAADIVTVSTPFLLDYYSGQRNHVYMVRNGVNMFQFTKRKHTTAKPVIGWAGATAYRNNDLEQLREWLPDFLEEHDLYFHHAGADPNFPSFADVAGISRSRMTSSRLCPVAEYADGLKFDIGVVPLNDIPFNEAKSNIKGLEYSAAGIPFVASPLPEYRALHEDGVGLLAGTADEWRAQMTYLLDYKNRKRASAIGHKVVSEKWAIENRGPDWAEVLSHISEAISQRKRQPAGRIQAVATGSDPAPDEPPVVLPLTPPY